VIRKLASEYPVGVLCAVLDVSRSGYYAWLRRPQSAHRRRDEVLLPRIRKIFYQHRERYGSPRVHQDLQAAGERCSGKRVARLMREEGLQARSRKSFVVTTESIPGAPAAPNLLARQFKPGGPPVWAADITYIHTGEGFLYFAVVMSLSCRKVIGFGMSARMTGQLALDALQMALDQAGPVPGLIHHSDRGGHYTAAAYQALLAKHGIRPSMSRRGDCYDNAVVESLFHTVKREEFDWQMPKTIAEAKRRLFEYLEVYYNRQRRHSSLGYVSPVVYEKRRSVS
jgi:putative transposase